MTHPRTLIRRAFRDRLKAAVEAVEGRAFASRLAPIDTEDDEELPCILVYVRDERRDPKTDYGPDGEDSWTSPHLKIVTEGIVRANANVDDKLDDLAEAIEVALDDWEIPGFEGATIRLAETDIDVVTEGVSQPIGGIGLVWHVDYTRPWRERDPGTRPDTVDIIINGGLPERLITHDKGPKNP